MPVTRSAVRNAALTTTRSVFSITETGCGLTGVSLLRGRWARRAGTVAPADAALEAIGTATRDLGAATPVVHAAEGRLSARGLIRCLKLPLHPGHARAQKSLA